MCDAMERAKDPIQQKKWAQVILKKANEFVVVNEKQRRGLYE